MLGLRDDAKWEIEGTEITPSLNLVEHLKFEFSVKKRIVVRWECYGPHKSKRYAVKSLISGL